MLQCLLISNRRPVGDDGSFLFEFDPYIINVKNVGRDKYGGEWSTLIFSKRCSNGSAISFHILAMLNIFYDGGVWEVVCF